MSVEIRIKNDDDYDFSIDEIEFGTFATWHRRMNLGHINGAEGREFCEDLGDAVVKIPVYIYQHGGFVLSTGPFSCPFDSGQVGWWTFTSEDIKSIYGEDTEDARKKAAVGVLDALQHINDVYSGNVWGFEIIDFDGEVADSCWGFIGDGAIESMKAHVPDNLHESLEKAWEDRHG